MSSQEFLPVIPSSELSLFKVCPMYAVLFTMIGCGWCEKIRPDIKSALKNKGLIPIVEIVLQGEKGFASNEDFVNKEGVKGFPAIKKYDNKSGVAVTFEGPRTPENIAKFLKM
jgi:hypothetical protein